MRLALLCVADAAANIQQIYQGNASQPQIEPIIGLLVRGILALAGEDTTSEQERQCLARGSLAPWCASIEHIAATTRTGLALRRHLAAYFPWNDNRWTYATNGQIALRIPRLEKNFPELSAVPLALDLFDHPVVHLDWKDICEQYEFSAPMHDVIARWRPELRCVGIDVTRRFLVYRNDDARHTALQAARPKSPEH